MPTARAGARGRSSGRRVATVHGAETSQPTAGRANRRGPRRRGRVQTPPGKPGYVLCRDHLTPVPRGHTSATDKRWHGFALDKLAVGPIACMDHTPGNTLRCRVPSSYCTTTACTQVSRCMKASMRARMVPCSVPSLLEPTATRGCSFKASRPRVIRPYPLQLPPQGSRRPGSGQDFGGAVPAPS